jgi:hypothetical protein
MWNKLLVFMAVIALFSTSCETNDASKKETPSQFQNGVFILNEGVFKMNNASLSFFSFDSAKVYNDVYAQLNGGKLGDVAQSMNIIDNKAFIVMNNSGKIVVLDLQTGKLIKEINGFTSPRYILPVSSEKAYVSDLYGSEIKIVNLVSLEISGKIPAFTSTEQMVLYKKNVFVCNWSNGQAIEVINTESDTKIKEIKVSLEPGSMVMDVNHKIWVLCSGGFTGAQKPALVKIDAETQAIEKTFTFTKEGSYPSRLALNQTSDSLYFIDTDMYKMSTNATELPSTAFLLANGKVFYNLGINPKNGDIFVSDVKEYAQIGTVYQYTKSGNLLRKFDAGIIPSFFFFTN